MIDSAETPEVDVAIVGGGFSGVMVAINAARMARERVSSFSTAVMRLVAARRTPSGRTMRFSTCPRGNGCVRR